MSVEVRLFRWGEKWSPGSARAVARAINVTVRTVQDWRRLPHYDQALVRALAADAYAAHPPSHQVPKRPDARITRDLAGHIKITLPEGLHVLWTLPNGPLLRGKTQYVRQIVADPATDGK